MHHFGKYTRIISTYPLFTLTAFDGVSIKDLGEEDCHILILSASNCNISGHIIFATKHRSLCSDFSRILCMHRRVCEIYLPAWSL